MAAHSAVDSDSILTVCHFWRFALQTRSYRPVQGTGNLDMSLASLPTDLLAPIFAYVTTTSIAFLFCTGNRLLGDKIRLGRCVNSVRFEPDFYPAIFRNMDSITSISFSAFYDRSFARSQGNRDQLLPTKLIRLNIDSMVHDSLTYLISSPQPHLQELRLRFVLLNHGIAERDQFVSKLSDLYPNLKSLDINHRPSRQLAQFLPRSLTLLHIPTSMMEPDHFFDFLTLLPRGLLSLSCAFPSRIPENISMADLEGALPPNITRIPHRWPSSRSDLLKALPASVTSLCLSKAVKDVLLHVPPNVTDASVVCAEFELDVVLVSSTLATLRLEHVDEPRLLWSLAKSDLPRLTALEIQSFNNIGPAAEMDWPNKSALQSLKIENNSLNRIDSLASLPTSLTNLSLEGTRVPTIDCLLDLSRLSACRRLRLKDVHVDDDKAFGDRHASQLPRSLTFLYLGPLHPRNHELTAEGWNALPPLLTRLHVYHPPLDVWEKDETNATSRRSLPPPPALKFLPAIYIH